MTSKTLLVEEIKLLLDGDSGSVSQLLLKASRLANLCGDVWHEELFKLHLDGLEVDEIDLTQALPPDLAPEITKAFYQDRMLDSGRSDSRPLKQLELWCLDLPAFNSKINAEENLELFAEIPQLISELTIILGKIKSRVAQFIKNIDEEAFSPLPTGHDVRTGTSPLIDAIRERTAKPTLTLIMKGGGIKGLAYVGALKELIRYYDFNWYAGTSAGAIAAALLASGVDVEDLERILKETNFKEILLDSPKRWLLYNLVTKGGLYPGRKFQAWIGNIINNALDSPVPVHLNDLPKSGSVLKHRLSVYASTNQKRTLIFDSTWEVSSGTPVNFAVRCSMSIPFLFISETHAGARTFDGGVHNNYPVVALLGDNPDVEFIGLYLGPEVYEEEERQWPSLLSAIKDFFSTVFSAADMEALREYRDRTIVIDPRPVSTLNFNLLDEEKDFLLKAGRAAALKFLRLKSLPNGPTAAEVDAAREDARISKEAIMTLRNKRSMYQRFVRSAWVLLVIIFFTLVAVAVAGVFWFFR